MKKTFAVFVCVLLIASSLFALASCTPSEETDSLVVYNWADYIYDYEEDFKEYYKSVTHKNIEITYVTFDTNETMLTKIEKGDANVDVICPSEYAIQKLLESDSLVELNYFDEKKYVGDSVWDNYVHNSQNVDANIVGKIGEAFGSVQVGNEVKNMLDYFVPYMYGTLGILYNKHRFIELGIYDVDKMNAANWGILFNDNGSGETFSEELGGSILMKDSIRDSYVATLFYLLESKDGSGKTRLDGLTYQDENSPYFGTEYSKMPIGELINAVDDQLLKICEETLVSQKKQLFGYEVDFGKDDLLKGNAMVDLAWSGDAMYAVEESWNDAYCVECSSETGVETKDGYVCSECGGECGDYELSYYVPHTAGNIWFDGWVVPKTYNKQHTEAIKLFINFLNTPKVAAQNMLEIGYSSAVSPDAVRNDGEARKYLSAAYYVYDPEYWDMIDAEGEIVKKGEKLSEDDCDYASWEEFCEYFFDYRDEIDNSNWRYPFEIAAEPTDFDRSLSTLGVMRDFGVNNKKVVTMWNYARSAGVSAVPLLLWTLLALAVAVGVIVLVRWLIKLKAENVVVESNNVPQEAN